MAKKTYPTTVKDGHLYAEIPLRDIVHRCDTSDTPILAEIKRLYDENDKLRELVRDAIRVTWDCGSEKCPRWTECDKDIEFMPIRKLGLRAEELGIEVGE